MIKPIKRLIGVKLYCVAIVSALGWSSQVTSNPEFSQLLPPVRSATPTGLQFFETRSGALNLAYLTQRSTTTGDLEYLVYSNNHWSSPIAISGLQQNKRELSDIITLSSGIPMMLVRGDDTDYADFFGLPSAPAEPTNDNDPILPNVPQAELETLLDDNQRLYYRFFLGSSWSTPIVIPSTSRAANTVAAAGIQENAVVMFNRDIDKNRLTVTDNEIYITAFNNRFWSEPVRLTDNNLPEFNLQIEAINNQYIAVWTTDLDGDVTTTDDWRFNYALINANGEVATQGQITSQDQTDAIPLLAISNGQAFVFWQSNSVSTDDLRRPIITSSWSGNSWTTPSETGLLGLQVVSAKMYSTDAGELLIYNDSNAIQAALKIDESWHYAGVLANLDPDKTGFRIAELNYQYSRGSLWLALSAHIAGVGETDEDDEVGNGIYVATLPIGYDLAPVIATDRPYVKRLGSQAFIDFKVANLGSLPSTAYDVGINQNGQRLETLSGASLTPGAVQEFSYEITLDQAVTPFEIEVLPSDSNDLNSANHILPYTLKILPDFFARSIVRTSDTQFQIDIVERKGVSTPPVPVDLLLIEDGERNLVATTIFDANRAELITINSDELRNKNNAYQLLVQVNTQRNTAEDDYSNNQVSFIFEPAADLTISQFTMTDEQVHIVVRNQGSMPLATTDLLLTDDPQDIGSASLPSNPWFYQSDIVIADNGEAEIILERNSLPALEGTTLYAVVNPLGAITESNRNNNQSKFIIASSEENIPEVPELVLNSLIARCDNLHIQINNVGPIVANSPRLRLVHSDGTITDRVLNNIQVQQNIDTIFYNLAYGEYQVQLQYQASNGQIFVTESTINLEQESDCSAVDNNDLVTESLRYVGLDEQSNELVFQVQLTANGYDTNYRKPLLRLPINIQLIANERAYYSNNKIVYLPSSTTTLIELRIPQNVLPSLGEIDVDVIATQRLDENIGENNTSMLTIDLENL